MANSVLIFVRVDCHVVIGRGCYCCDNLGCRCHLCTCILWWRRPV